MDHTIFMPHGVCLMWQPLLVWLHAITDSIIALSYYSIPAALFLVTTAKRENIAPRPLLLLFGLFIFFCGGGHALDVVDIWKPHYWLKGWWNVGTAVSSALTAIVLIPRVLEYVRMPEVNEQLRRESDLLRSIIDSVSDGIVLVGRKGVPERWNAAAARILGDPPRIDWGHRPGTAHDTETRGDGRIIERFTTSVAPHGQLYVFRDITERERVRDKLVQTQKMQSLGTLAGGVAHQFNNMLTGIIGNTSMALETLPAQSPARNMLADALRSTERAAYLTRQMLAFSGRGRFIVERLDVSARVHEISGLLESSIPDNIRIEVQLAPDLPKVEADASQVQQALTNLVMNAAEAIGEQPGLISISTGVCETRGDASANYFTPGELAAGRYVYVQVRDTGSGMEPPIMPKIFDPFFTTKFTGRGLGLPAVLGIVRGHKGGVQVSSSPGRGSTFRILFPATEGAR